MNFKKICLTFLSAMISGTPCCSNAMNKTEVICKTPGDVNPRCTVCGELVKDGEGNISLECNHTNHASCLWQIDQFLVSSFGRDYAAPANYCFECNIESKRNWMHGNCEDEYATQTHRLSKEKLEEIATVLYPELTGYFD